MKVLYATKKLEKSLTNVREMQKAYPEQWQSKLRLRIKELEIANDLEELQAGPGKWHPLKGNLTPMWAGSVSANYRILITPAADGDGIEVSEVTVERISDYH